jgi:hypothetical protein
VRVSLFCCTYGIVLCVFVIDYPPFPLLHWFQVANAYAMAVNLVQWSVGDVNSQDLNKALEGDQSICEYSGLCLCLILQPVSVFAVCCMHMFAIYVVCY